MKNRKLSKILGVVLTLSLVFSLGLVFTAAPVAADDDEWSMYDFPAQGAGSDYFFDITVTDGPAVIDRDADGYFWAYVQLGAGNDHVIKSLDTEGRTWDLTAYDTDFPGGGPVVDIDCSPLDADVAYIIGGTTNTVYKTLDGGDSWAEVGNAALLIDSRAAAVVLADIAVGWDDDGDARVFVSGTSATPEGIVFYMYDVAFGTNWMDLTADVIGAVPLGILGLSVSPAFEDDAFQSVLAINATDTYIAYHVGSNPGGWADILIQNTTPAAFVAVDGSDPAYPEDFNSDDFNADDQEIFVGIDGALHAAGNGGVVRICGVTPACREILDPADLTEDIISLDVVGNVGNVQLLAGESGRRAASGCDVWYSYDDGEQWDSAGAQGIQPAGAIGALAGNTYVIMDDDFDEDTGMGWAATDAVAVATETCFSGTIDGGASWQGYSLINTDSVNLFSFAVQAKSPDTVWWFSDDTAGDADLFRFDGSNWERVYEENQYAGALIANPDAVTAYDDTVVLYDTAATTTDIIFSSNGGQTFADTDEEPCDDAAAEGINVLIMVDEETWWVGDSGIAGGGDLYVTDDAGDRCWTGPFDIVATADSITSLAVSGDTALAGNNDSEAFYSDDEGETWLQVDTGTPVDAGVADNTYVAFDDGDANIAYAAADDTLARFTDLSDLAGNWEAWDFMGDQAAFADTLAAQVTFNGISCLDGVVYASTVDLMTTDFDNDANAATVDAAGALWRCVNPLEDLLDADASDWDWPTAGLTVTAAVVGTDNFDGLQVTPIGSNALWCNDASLVTLWVYDDLLVGPTDGLLCDPGTDQLILEWDGLSGNATDWDVMVYSSEDMRAAYRSFDDNTADDDTILIAQDGVVTPGVAGHVISLDSCTMQWWKVRAFAPVHSKWSAVQTCGTGAGLLGIDEYTFSPTPGDVDVPLDPSFGWVNLSVDSYDFEFSTVADFSTIMDSASIVDPVYNLPMTLEYDTNYFWRARPVCGGTPGTWAYATFTTTTESAVAPAPPPADTPEIVIPPVQQITPKYIYAIIAIGASLAGLVIGLIVRTRRTS